MWTLKDRQQYLPQEREQPFTSNVRIKRPRNNRRAYCSRIVATTTICVSLV